MKNDKCPQCGYIFGKKYNYAKELTFLLSKKNKTIKKMLINVFDKIRANIPSDADIAKQYWFLRNTSKIPDVEMKYILEKYVASELYLDGKGFSYLKGWIIKYHCNVKIINKNQKMKYGSQPPLRRVNEK